MENMTRFDIYIRKKLLDALSLSHLELSVRQESLLEQMIAETYQNELLFPMSIEDRVAYVVKQYRSHIYAMA